MLYTEALYTETGTLSATPPFDFALSLQFVSDFTPMVGEQEVTATSLTKAIMLAGECIAFRVEDSGSLEQPEVRYTLFSQKPLEASIKQAVIERIRFFLSLDDDLKPFYARASQDEIFAPIVQRLYGLHHIKFLTLCEIACWATLGQHRPIAIARKMKDAIVRRYGASITVEGHEHWAFPELDRLIGVPVEEFETLTKNARCAQYLCEVVDALTRIDEEFLRTAPYDEAETALRRVKGIGPWSAGFILFRGLGRMERVSLNMRPFQLALAKVYQSGVTLEQLSQRYGESLGYWSFYLRNAE